MNPLGQMVNNYLMKMAIPLGVWFIAEYMLSIAALQNLFINFLLLILRLATPIALWWILRRLRRTILNDAIMGIQAWTFGVQLMFFAGLIEAIFIYVFNEFIKPGNLLAVKQATIEQYENAYETLKQLGAYSEYLPSFKETLEQLRDAPVLSPIDSAISSLSKEIFIGMLLMIPIALIIRKKPSFQNPQENIQ